MRAAPQDTLGDKLDAFTITNAAKDLGNVIERTRAPGQKTFVWGGSYGTYWALRYLQVHPDQSAGVVLDSIASPGVQFLSQFDAQFDGVAQKLADACAADATCAAKLGPDPWARVGSLYEKLDAGHCPELGITRPLAQQVLASLLMRWKARRIVMPLVHRLDRCEPADIAAVGSLFQFYFGEPREDRGFSIALQVHISFSEMWEDPPPSAEELQGRVDGAYFSPGFTTYVLPAFDGWRRYAHDTYTNGWPDTATPVLMLNGSMDPQTPLETAQVAAERLTAHGQTFVAVPDAVHGVLTGSPVATPGALPCGSQITFSFLEDPASPPDTSCLSDLLPISFDIPTEEAQQIFGADDAWENAPMMVAPSPAPAVPVVIDAEAVLRELRRRAPLLQ